jgi:ABC-type maltose transport system permease subunit
MSILWQCLCVTFACLLVFFTYLFPIFEMFHVSVEAQNASRTGKTCSRKFHFGGDCEVDTT